MKPPVSNPPHLPTWGGLGSAAERLFLVSFQSGEMRLTMPHDISADDAETIEGTLLLVLCGMRRRRGLPCGDLRAIVDRILERPVTLPVGVEDGEADRWQAANIDPKEEGP